MKLPKVRDTMYVVLRKYGMLNNDQSVHTLYVCRSLERAEELREVCAFEYQEKNIVGFKFVVQATNYVDD